MSNYMDLLNDSVISQWIETVNVKPNTVKSYLIGMQKYIEFCNLTPDELLTEAEDEDANKVPMRKRKILTRRLNFRKHLTEKTNLSPNSIRNQLNGVKSFYRCAYLQVPELPRTSTIEPQAENVEFITKDEIRQVLKIADPLEKAIVLVGLSSGMGASDIRNLKVIDFKNGQDDVTKITRLNITRIKTGVKYTTFLTPEATDAVDAYLKYRNRMPKRRTQERLNETKKQHVTRDEGYLFIVRHVSNEYLNIPENETDDQWQSREELRHIDDNTFAHIYEKLSEKCSKCTGKGWSVVRSHNMRKFFNSTLVNSGFEFIKVDYMMGHKPDAVKGAYNKHDPESLKEFYKSCVPYLTISEELNIFDNPLYKDALADNKTLARMAADAMMQVETMKATQEQQIEAAVNQRWDKLVKDISALADVIISREKDNQIDLKEE